MDVQAKVLCRRAGSGFTACRCTRVLRALAGCGLALVATYSERVCCRHRERQSEVQLFCMQTSGKVRHYRCIAPIVLLPLLRLCASFMPHRRDITWLALTRTVQNADIYLGLAAGLDDVLVHQIRASKLVAYPLQHVRVSATDEKQLPLRVLSVRDPSIVQVTPLPGNELRDHTFQRVRVSVSLHGSGDSTNRERTAVEEKRCADEPIDAEFSSPGNVMVFLLVVGMPQEREDDFFRRVVDDYLAKEWMTISKLLHELGGVDSQAAAEKQQNT